MSTDQTPPLPVDGWARVTCLDDQPCAEGISLFRKERPGKAPYLYSISNGDGCSTTLKFRNTAHFLGAAGWTHEHLLMALIDRLIVLERLKPIPMRGAALSELMVALTYLTAPEGSSFNGNTDERVGLRARVAELEAQLAGKHP